MMLIIGLILGFLLGRIRITYEQPLDEKALKAREDNAMYGLGKLGRMRPYQPQFKSPLKNSSNLKEFEIDLVKYYPYLRHLKECTEEEFNEFNIKHEQCLLQDSKGLTISFGNSPRVIGISNIFYIACTKNIFLEKDIMSIASMQQDHKFYIRGVLK